MFMDNVLRMERARLGDYGNEEDIMETDLSIQEMDMEIKAFCDEYAGTDIGTSIYHKRVNTYDTDYDRIKDIWEEIQNI